MEYYQLTINDWLSMKQKLQAELLGVRRSFVRIGYMLRKIDEAKGYEHDGYKSIAEWAKGEYGLEGSTVSRFMAINREYSIGGFSEELLPEFEDFKRSQLEEMLRLPMADRTMITPETPRADIRELKAFNKQKVEGVADDIEEFLEKFIEDNWDIAVELEGYSGDVDLTKETMIPSGNRSYRKGLFFLMANEQKVSIKKYGGQPEEYTWQQFTQILSDIFEERSRREEDERKNKPKEVEIEDEHKDVAEDTLVESSDAQTHEADQTGTGGDYHSDEPADGITGQKGVEDSGYCETAGFTESGAGGTETAVEEEGQDTEREGCAPGETGEDGEPDCEVESGAAETETVYAESDQSDEQSAETSTDEEAPVIEIAPAQKTAEILEREASDEVKNGENHGAAEEGASEPQTEEAEGEETKETEYSFEAMNQPEVIEKTYGSRKDYMDTLTAYGMAMYMAEEYERHNLKASSLAFPSELEKWLLQEVDESGREIEEVEE